jgi:hypothetical protein
VEFGLAGHLKVNMMNIYFLLLFFVLSELFRKLKPAASTQQRHLEEAIGEAASSDPRLLN